MKKHKFIFDVDGTLTPSRKHINPNFKEWLLAFSAVNDTYIVSGSDYAKTVEQLGLYLCTIVKRVYSCSGNECRENDELLRSNAWNIPPSLESTLQGWLIASKFPNKTGAHIEHRSGTVNFSIVGRNATNQDRKLYIAWDADTRERESIAYHINTSYDNITAVIGGETGIDIYPTGWDKSQILSDFDTNTETLHFFGDSTYPGGNDYALANKLKNVYTVTSWDHTWQILQSLQDKGVALSLKQ